MSELQETVPGAENAPRALVTRGQRSFLMPCFNGNCHQSLERRGVRMRRCCKHWHVYGLVTTTPERLAHLIALPQQRRIVLSAEQELLESQKWHPSTAPEVCWSTGGIIVSTGSHWAFREMLLCSLYVVEKNPQKTKTANSWHLESGMCQAVKPHPCSTCVSLSLQAFGCEREALSCLEREEVLIYFGISKRSSMAPQPSAWECRQRWWEDSLEEGAWLLISLTWRQQLFQCASLHWWWWISACSSIFRLCLFRSVPPGLRTS